MRPYLTEKVNAGDRFNILAFGGLLFLLACVGLWLWSSKDLIGGFFGSLGVFGEPVKANVITVSNTPTPINVNVSGIEWVTYPTLQPQNTQTPYPTYTPYPKLERLQPTATERTITYDYQVDVIVRSQLYEAYYSSKEPYETVNGKYSYYWPPLGGINCDVVQGKEECEYMANGQRVEDWVGIAWACSPDIPLGTVLYVQELDLWGVCKDRGGLIVQDADGLFWFDHLLDYPLLNWSSPITVKLFEP